MLYGTIPEYLWKDSPDSAILRADNGKWYALFMNTLLKRLMRDKLNSDEYDDFEKLLDEAGNNAWKKEIDFLGTRGGMIEHIWCEHGIDKRKFSVCNG